MNKNDKIYVAGHLGMVGSAIVRRLIELGYDNLIVKTHKELDLCNQAQVEEFFTTAKPDIVVLAAARVGGIAANIASPADFLYENLAIQNNVIHQSYLSKVKKLCFVASSCIYPCQCEQPMKEEYLLTGIPEPTNEGYALAKIAGCRMAHYYANQYAMNTITSIPCNLYGTNDHFDLATCHVLSALVKRFCDAVDENKKDITLWGTGKARREFLHVDDFARAQVMLLEKYNKPEHLNVGSGTDVSIKELAEIIRDKANFAGSILWDESKPDGMMRKCLDISKLTEIGFKIKISLSQGIEMMIDQYRNLNSGK
jgi:GDP-L-fucose synthase